MVTRDTLTEALLYQKLADQRVLCNLCPHRCLVTEGKRGICQVRENRQGSFYTHVFGNPLVQNVDTVEKKPLFHFHPGSTTYSLATHGCNFHCGYCINWEISQSAPTQQPLPGQIVQPAAIVQQAQQARCQSIAYTYVEPTIFFEYWYEIAQLATAAGLYNLVKTNGFITREAVALAIPYLNAANVDLKSFRDATYQQFGGRLQPVLDTLCRLKAAGLWLEVTTVLIPGLTDDLAEIKAIATFIYQELGPDTPWHITRFFPTYQMENVPPTPPATLYQARTIGLEVGLRHLYLGNFLENGAQDTVCPHCGDILIRRRGFQLLEKRSSNGHCPGCGLPIAGHWEPASEGSIS